MIYIGYNQNHIEQIAKDWCAKLGLFLTTERRYYIETIDPVTQKKHRDYYKTYIEKVEEIIKRSDLSNDEKDFCKQYFATYCENLLDYAKAKESRLLEIKENYQRDISSRPKVHVMLSKIFVDLYEDFTEEYAYYFFQQLNIRTCPYCNRNYTFTIHGKGKKTRPEFDHFYDKATTPVLAVSFYNLVPSCHTCNHVKRNDALKINPYFHGFQGLFKISENGKYMGYVSGSADEIHDMQTLGLDQIYMQHDDYVQELFAKAQAYNEHAREALIDSFQGAGQSPSDVFEFVWGKNLETAKQINRPLSKLTRDVLQQVGVIPEENAEQ